MSQIPISNTLGGEEMQRHLSYFFQFDYGHKSRLSEPTSGCRAADSETK